MSILDALLNVPAATAKVGGEQSPEPELVSTPRRMPNLPDFPMIPSASIGALDATAAPNGPSAIVNLLLVAAVGGAAYWFGKSRGRDEGASSKILSKDDLIPGTSITISGQSVAQPAARVGAPTVKVGASQRGAASKRGAPSTNAIVRETLVEAPPPTLRSGMVPSLDYEFTDEEFGGYSPPTRRY